MRMDLLDVTQDDRHFTDGRAVLEHPGGNDATWIDRAVSLGMLRACASAIESTPAGHTVTTTLPNWPLRSR
jgi:hypothetical protein